MKLLAGAIWITFTLCVAAPSQAAETPEVEYKARLSKKDHVDALGGKLSEVAKILFQDRVNVHVLGKRDSEDEVETYFADKQNRRRLSRRIRASKIDLKTREAIEDGTPLVLVRVFKGHIEVELLESPKAQ